MIVADPENFRVDDALDLRQGDRGSMPYQHVLEHQPGAIRATVKMEVRQSQSQCECQGSEKYLRESLNGGSQIEG